MASNSSSYVIQWMEKEIVRLNRLRDIASGKGHKKGYPFVTQFILISLLLLFLLHKIDY